MKKIYFEEEKRPYKVRAYDGQYAICTKPYNFRKNTVFYTIVDFKNKIRGTDNMVFSIYDYYSDEDCQSALKDLISGELSIGRNRIPLKIVKIL